MNNLRTYKLSPRQRYNDSYDFVGRSKRTSQEVHKLLTTGEVTVPRDFDMFNHIKRSLTGTEHVGLVIFVYFIGEDGEEYEQRYVCGESCKRSKDKFEVANTSFADALLKARSSKKS